MKLSTNGKSRSEKTLATPGAVNAAIKSVCDVMRRSNCAGAMQYVPELTWLLFLRILDEREMREEEESAVLGLPFTPALEAPYRWRDWAAPLRVDNEGKILEGGHRKALFDAGGGALMKFVNGDLIPHLKELGRKDAATDRQKIISEVMSSVDRTRIDTETNLLDVLDRVHGISESGIDTTHVFPLSQVYEGLLLQMGEKGNDGGQFFTPREIIRAMLRAVDPELGRTIYDPCCGTGGFLAEAYEYLESKWRDKGGSPAQLEYLKTRTFYGREKENLVYPMALANLVLHGIDVPNLWHGNTLTGDPTYADLFTGAPEQFDYILTNPPFGGKEGKAAQSQFAYKTSATQVLFLQHIIDALKDGGTCALVIDEGVLFRTNEKAFVQTKRKLLDDCDLWCILSLPGGVFANAGAGVKTNILFFTKGTPTEKIWYYDLSHLKVTKTRPLTAEHLEEFFRLLPVRADSDKSWTVDLSERKAHAKLRADKLRQKAVAPAAEAARLAEQVKEMRKRLKAEPDLQASIDETEARQKEKERDAKDLQDRAQAIEDAVYDLKAVNPNAEADTDDRTPEELLDLIEEKGKEVADALSRLRALVPMAELQN